MQRLPVGPIIDAHHHFWDPSRGDYAWMAQLDARGRETLLRPMLPAVLAPLLAQNGVARTIAVQAASTVEESEYLLALAEQAGFVAGVVCWADFDDPGFERQLDRWQRSPKFVGVRPMIQDIEDPLWQRRPRVRQAFACLEERGVCFDFLIKPPQLPETLRTLDERPRLRAVIDHLAKPYIARGEIHPWLEQLQAVAGHENVYCKLSGMVTEADHRNFHPRDLLPYVAAAVHAFGPERLMFGSDWPVCTLVASYHQVLSALLQCLRELALPEAALARIFSGTAARFYRVSTHHEIDRNDL